MRRPTATIRGAAGLALCLSVGAGAVSGGLLSSQRAESPADIAGALASSLTFHASFDNGVDADRAAGDPRLYTAPSYKEQDQAGLPSPGSA